MTNLFTIRRASDADRALVLQTLAEYLPEADAERRYEWLYAGNPHGRALTWLAIADAGGTVAGLTSFFQRRLIIDGVESKGALGGDGYVRPAFRRRGLGRMLHAASRADMPKERVRVMFGTPMPANLTPLTQVGAKTIADTVTYVRPLQARALHLPAATDRWISRLLQPRGSARLDPMAASDARVDDVWAQTRGELGIATVRDAAFYTWRFLQSPSQKQKPFVVIDGGRPIAACALEQCSDRLRIVDLLAPGENWGRAFGAIIAAFGSRCAVLEMKLVKEDGQARWMWRHGFLARGTKPLNLLLPPGDPDADVLYDPKRWYFTWAEADMDHA